MTPLLSFIALLPRLLLGFCIVHFIWNATDGKSLLVKVFLSAAVGFGVSSLLGFLWIWLSLPLVAYVVFESVMSVILTGWLLLKNRDVIRSIKFPKLSVTIWGTLLFAGVLVFVFNLVLYSRQFPHGRPDAWINWNVAARFIYLGGTDWQSTFLRQFDHPDYPLFTAVANAITWTFLGSTSTWGPIAFHFTVSIFTAGSLFALVNFFRDFKQASLAGILFMALPFVVDQGMRQYADLLLAYIFLAAGSLTLLYIQTKESRIALLTGLLIGLGGWAKNEGISAILGLSLGWALIAIKVERSALKNYIFGLLFPLVVIALFKLFLAPSTDLFSAQGNSLAKIFDPSRYLLILKVAVSTLWDLGGLPVPLIGLIIFAAIFIGRTVDRIPGTWTIGLFAAFQLAAYFVIFLLTPNDLLWHLNTSLDRLYLHVLPLLLLWFFIWLKSPREFSPKVS
ncbi:MAG: hypothetical protein H6634_09395 [Anaerolineales bacterium]|nr:hypothetical protein [Anaerolineales bacterium]